MKTGRSSVSLGGPHPKLMYGCPGRKGGRKASHHVPYSQNDGARPDMAAQAAARRVPPVPRRNHPRHGANLETSS